MNYLWIPIFLSAGFQFRDYSDLSSSYSGNDSLYHFIKYSDFSSITAWAAARQAIGT